MQSSIDILNDIRLQLNSLVIFRNLLGAPVIAKLDKLIANIGDPAGAVSSYAEFVSELYRDYNDFSEYLYDFMLEDDNFYIRAKSNGTEIDGVIEKALKNELITLQGLSRLRSEDVKKFIGYDGFLPDWNTSDHDFISAYENRVQTISKRGFGVFSKYHVFAVSGDRIVPVKYPDPQRLAALACYERERNLVVENTKALLKGGEAANVLLYGDAGTGKSSTVKAVVNQYKDEGLRLVEVKKNQLRKLPDILGQLADNPLKFIIFIDDLSFTENDDDFSSLKALLEGGVSAKSGNVAIYATSNRRHLVKERLSNRDGDDLHVNDTLQDISGLSARFGLTIVFQKPGKDVYLEIVKHLAADHDIEAGEQLLMNAEAFAVRSGGRSPRAAKQFISAQLRY